MLGAFQWCPLPVAHDALVFEDSPVQQIIVGDLVSWVNVLILSEGEALGVLSYLVTLTDSPYIEV